jgi:hypothetical protein
MSHPLKVKISRLYDLALALIRFLCTRSVVQGAYSARYIEKSAAASAAASETNEWEREYSQVLKAVKEFSEKFGRRPRILVAKMGQGTCNLVPTFLMFIHLSIYHRWITYKSHVS